MLFVYEIQDAELPELASIRPFSLCNIFSHFLNILVEDNILDYLQYGGLYFIHRTISQVHYVRCEAQNGIDDKAISQIIALT